MIKEEEEQEAKEDKATIEREIKEIETELSLLYAKLRSKEEQDETILNKLREANAKLAELAEKGKQFGIKYYG